MALLCLIMSIIKTGEYNKVIHRETFAGESLFSTVDSEDGDGVYVSASARDSTWTKVFDLNNEGLTEHNYQAYTYDVSVLNNTSDEVSNYSFRLTFSTRAFLSSAWNGALEIHQNVAGEEIVDTVADLREFIAADHELQTVVFDGETLIPMAAGDYIVYYPSSTASIISRCCTTAERSAFRTASSESRES